MAFKTFAPGVLTSSDLNTFLMRQAVITCTSSTRPASPSEGMTIYETDTDRYKTYSGSAWEDGFRSGAWVSYTPTVSTWGLGNGTITGAYQKVGRLVHAEVEITFGSTSTFSAGIAIGLPVNRASFTSTGGKPVGIVACRDASSGDQFQGIALLNQSVNNIVNVALFVHNNAYNHTTYQEVAPTLPFTWTTSDSMLLSFTYEATS